MSKSFREPLPLKPYSRSVSIIGVGCTPFMHIVDDPETDGLTPGEMFGYAAIEAMEDAGIESSDIEYYFHGQCAPSIQDGYITPGIHVANWFGMKGRPGSHHSEACCTGYVALAQAVNLVASGVYDIVLSGCCDTVYSCATPGGKPSIFRNEITPDQMDLIGEMIYSKDYTLPALGGNACVFTSWIEQYSREHGLSDETVDDVMLTLSKINRRAAVLNPLGLADQTYEELAEEFGFASADEYLRSEFNPKINPFMHVSNLEAACDGAAAVIVCPTEMAYKYTDHPIEVVGFGHSCIEGLTGNLEKYATVMAYEQVKEATGLTGKDMDLFLSNDFFGHSQFLSAEICEYLPEGEAWKYILDGRTDFTGDFPINTNGGRCHFGHAHGTSGLADLYEAVHQLRGDAGATQIAKKDPKYAMLRGFGGGQNVSVSILKKL